MAVTCAQIYMLLLRIQETVEIINQRVNDGVDMLETLREKLASVDERLTTLEEELTTEETEESSA